MKLVVNVYALGFVSYEGRGRRDPVRVEDGVKEGPRGIGRSRRQ